MVGAILGRYFRSCAAPPAGVTSAARRKRRRTWRRLRRLRPGRAPGPPSAPAGPGAAAGPGGGAGAAPGAAQGPALPAQAATAQAQDFDPVQRFRLLLPQLKESLQTLMKVAAQNLVQNSSIDNGQKSADGALQRFDKSLEEFYALCDQLELCLRLAHECLAQSFDSAKHAPALVRGAKAEGLLGRRGAEPALHAVPAPDQGADRRRQGHPQRAARGHQQDHGPLPPGP
uniref:Mediator of RNA polymerase II transcription subunit 29 n=1 Tax=Geospiza parvula TaxID=87175 RepID=A0A8U8BTZ1_GEOPR